MGQISRIAHPQVCVIDGEGVRISPASLLRSAGFDVHVFAASVTICKATTAGACACLVLDIRLDGEDGLDVQQALIEGQSGTQILLITGFADAPMTVSGMRAGAVNFLTKPFSDDDIIEAVREAVDADAGRREARSQADDLRERYETLRPREREVMAMVTLGLMNKQIAGRLEISEVTVKIHRGHMMTKMQARSVVDLVRMADALRLRETTKADSIPSRAPPPSLPRGRRGSPV
jgi:FixJ family two-component response regulator